MKAKLITIIGLVMSMLTLPVLAESCQNPPSGLISWWRGDNNGDDSWACNHGILVNGAHYAPGLFGQAIEFDGVNDYFGVPASTSLSFAPNTEATIEFWYFSYDSRLPLHFLGKRVACTNAGGFNYQAATDLNLPVTLPNQWVHWAQVYRTNGGIALLIYTNGVLRVTINGVTFGPQNGVPLKIGTSDNCPNSQSLYGKMDEIRIYNRALSAAEIVNIVNNKTVPWCGVLQLTITPIGGNQVKICWPSRTCRVYELDYATSLTPPIQWHNLLSDVWGTGNPYCYTDNTGGQQRFYRVTEYQ